MSKKFKKYADWDETYDSDYSYDEDRYADLKERRAKMRRRSSNHKRACYDDEDY